MGTDIGGETGTAVGTVFVNRGREVDELRAALAAANEGRGGLVMLGGEAGVGKTRLAERLAADARDTGARVVWSRCWDGGGAPAYWPWVQVLRTLVRDCDPAHLAVLSGPGGAQLATLVPEIARRLPDLPEPPSVESEHARFALFDAVTTFLREEAGEEPLLLVFDDLHGADQPSLLLLQFAAREVQDARILILGIFRELEARLDPSVGQVIAELGRDGRRLPLRGLDPRYTARFIEALTGESPPDAVARAVHRATDGNPFFLDEVVRLHAAEGRLLELRDDGALAMEIPDGVREAIRQRMERLSPAVRELLELASVIGRDFSLAALERVTGAPRVELVEGLGEAVAAGIVVAKPGAIGSYGFTHALIRETLYGGLGPAKRVRAHADVAAALEELYADDPEPHLAELAHHFFEAAAGGELTKAIDYAVRAGERAMALLAFEEAAGHHERALNAFGLEERADVPRRCDLLLALGEAQSRAGRATHARETFSRAAGLARKLESPERLARAALGYGAGLGGFEFGRVDETLVGLLGEARTALGEEDSALHARVIGRLAAELYFSDRHDERAGLSRAAVEMAARVGDPNARASTLAARHLALWGPENAGERLDIAEEILRLGVETGDRELALRGHGWKVVDHVELGDVRAADEELEAHAALAQALRDPLHLWYAPLFRAMRALLEGRFADAERLAAEAYETGRRVQAQNALQLYHVQLFTLRAEQGRLGELEEAPRAMVERYPTFRVWRGGLARAYAAQGKTAEARELYDELAADRFGGVRRDGEWSTTMANLAEVCTTLGDATGAAALYELMLPSAGHMVIVGRGAACFGPIERYLGRLATTLGRYDEAEAHLERARVAMAAMGARPILARTQLDLAELLRRRGGPGDAARAAELLARAGGAAERLGMADIAPRVEALSDAAPSAPAPAAAPSAAATATLRREGDFWTVAFSGAPFRLKDAKGLRHLARLIASPEIEFHAADLVSGEGPARGAASASAVAEGVEIASGADDAGPLLDEQAKRAYKARIDELREEVAEAEEWGDPERASRAREELEAITRELASAVGLGGRDRKAASSTERARVNATRAIRSAIERIAENDPALGRHLESAVRTGTFCSYRPDPGAGVSWELAP